MHWGSINSTINPDPSLIHLSMLYGIYWKDLSRPNLRFFSIFVDEFKYVGVNLISPFGLYFLTQFLVSFDT